MTLDDVLKEVEPIFQGSNFTHPSFQEVLTARQFAEEINSGKLSAKEAYVRFWSVVKQRESKKLGEYRTIRPEQKNTLTHLSKMLSDKPAGELLQAISDSYLSCKKQSDFSRTSSFNYAVLKDLSFCSRVVGDHPVLKDKRVTKRIIDGLMDVVYGRGKADCFLSFNQEHDFKDALDALGVIKSNYAAIKLLEYVRSLSHMPVCMDHHSFHERDLLSGDAYTTLDFILKGGVKIEEGKLMKLVDLKNFDAHDMYLLLNFGGIKSFETILKILSGKVNLFDFYFSRSDVFFSSFFDEIHKYGFEPRLVSKFNNVVAKIDNEDFEVMPTYRKALSEFSKGFKQANGQDLYDYLEAKGSQLYNSEVYKPK